MDMDGKESDFTRRKFSITKQLDKELEELADEHYQGNVSLCIRQSIMEHRKTLNGNGRLSIKRLSRTIAQVQDEIEQIAQSVEILADQIQSRNQHRDGLSSFPFEKQGQKMDCASHILNELAESDSALRVEDLIERAEVKPIEVRQSLGVLIDRGHVFESSSDPPRYQLACMDINNEISDSEGYA